MKSVVSEKGQVTIPKRVRQQLGIAPGCELEFEARDGALVAQKCLRVDVFSKWRGRGRIPGGGDVDGYLARIRGTR